MIPVPESETSSGELAASVVNLIRPVRVLPACGVNETFTTQLAAAAKVAPQVVESMAKSPGLVGAEVVEATMLAMFNVASPEL